MANSGRWGSERSETAWCRWPWSWSWSRSLRRTWSRNNARIGPNTAPWTPSGRSTGRSVRGIRKSSTRTCRATSRRHLDALLKTQGVELPRPELPEPGERLGGVREQVQPPLGVECDLDRAVVDPVVDPASLETQLRGELRHGQEAGDLPGVRLPVVTEQAMAKPDDPHGATQGRRVPRGVVPAFGQMPRDLFIRLPLPCQAQDRLLDLRALRQP